MCLSIVGKKEKLKKDLVVYKSVRKGTCGDVLITDDYFYELSKGVHTESHSNNTILADDGKSYTQGFHCFTKRHIARRWSIVHKTTQVIIPKGTVVRHGKQNIGFTKLGGEDLIVDIVVTPIMIVGRRNNKKK
jgi:hypothetical protein